MIPGGFDPNQHAPATGSPGQLPISDKNGHIVVITDSEMTNTSGNDGSTMLVLTLMITQGDNAGVSGPYRLNVGNKSQDATRIALGQLSAICHVVGFMQMLTDARALYNKPFRCVVVPQTGGKVEDRDKGYTTISHVLDLNGNKPGQKGPAAPTAQAPPAPAPAPLQAPPQFAPPQAQFPPQPALTAAPQAQFPPPQQLPPAFGQPPAFAPPFAPPPATAPQYQPPQMMAPQQPQQYQAPATQQPQQMAPWMVQPPQ